MLELNSDFGDVIDEKNDEPSKMNHSYQVSRNMNQSHLNSTDVKDFMVKETPARQGYMGYVNQMSARKRSLKGLRNSAEKMTHGMPERAGSVSAKGMVTNHARRSEELDSRNQYQDQAEHNSYGEKTRQRDSVTPMKTEVDPSVEGVKEEELQYGSMLGIV